MGLRGNSRPEGVSLDAGQERDLGIVRIFEDEPIWVRLSDRIRDAVFPAKLPPLELTSAPVPVVDRLAAKANPWAFGSATLVNGALLALALLVGMRAAVNTSTMAKPGPVVDLSQFHLIAPQSAQLAGGGGGGDQSLTDPVTGRLPKFERNPIAPPQVPVLEQPKIAVEAAVAVPPEVRLPENAAMPLIGVQYATKVTLASNGQGKNGGMGIGANGGLGPGIGDGLGPGENGGIGGNVYMPGGGVSNPVPIYTPEPEFSDEARRAKYQGLCMISVVVDAHGYPQDARVVRHLGMGLDERALAAVRQYRFKPARKDGKPVAVRITVEVNFRLF